MTLEHDEAISGTVVSPRVRQIIEHEKAGDEHQWEAARLIWEELADGKSIRQLASEIGKGKTSTAHKAKTWEVFGVRLGGQNLPDFNEAFHSPEVRGASAAKTPKPIEPPPEEEPEEERTVPDAPELPTPEQNYRKVLTYRDKLADLLSEINTHLIRAEMEDEHVREGAHQILNEIYIHIESLKETERYGRFGEEGPDED